MVSPGIGALRVAASEYCTPIAAHDAEGLLLTAAAVMESLDYLLELDAALTANPMPQDHSGDVVDVAYVRWASASAITLLDLLAASLGVLFCNHTDTEHRLSLRNLAPPKTSTAQGKAAWLMLPPAAQAWVRSIHQDRRYHQVLDIRNALIHNSRARHLTVGKAGRHRLKLSIRLIDVGYGIPDSSGPEGAEYLVSISHSLAADALSGFAVAVRGF